MDTASLCPFSFKSWISCQRAGKAHKTESAIGIELSTPNGRRCHKDKVLIPVGLVPSITGLSDIAKLY